MKFYQWMNSRKNKKGFTLIELIIVIAILAILAAILIPNMITYLDEAKAATAQTNARTAYSAATAAEAFVLSQGIEMPEDGDCVIGTATDELSKKTDELLGDNFTGEVTVTVTGGHVKSVKWVDAADENHTATYPN